MWRGRRPVTHTVSVVDARGYKLRDLFSGIPPNPLVARRLKSSPGMPVCASRSGVRNLTGKILDAIAVRSVHAQACTESGCAGEYMTYILYPCGSGCREGNYEFFYEDDEGGTMDEGAYYNGETACGGCQCAMSSCFNSGGNGGP